MIDLSGLVEIFMITNGRSTRDYCLEALSAQQGVKFKTTIIEGFPWLDANRKILKDCKAKFFIRVDDDMFLHPCAIHFMWASSRKQSSRICMRIFNLWEPWTRKKINGVKIYTHLVSVKIGFRISGIGKIDKLYKADARKFGCSVVSGDGILGIHGCSTFEEGLKYAMMRGEQKGKDFTKKRRWMKKYIGGFDMSLEKQLSLSRGFINKVNRRHKTKFYQFLLTRK